MAPALNARVSDACESTLTRARAGRCNVLSRSARFSSGRGHRPVVVVNHLAPAQQVALAAATCPRIRKVYARPRRADSRCKGRFTLIL